MSAGTSYRILVINPGSTSTKMAVFADDTRVLDHTITHPVEALRAFGGIWAQYPHRYEAVRTFARDHAEGISAIVAMGGLLRPVEGGTYRVNERMIADARANLQGEHASNSGCVLAQDLANEYHCPAFVVDPVSVDEFEPLARYSGHPLITRRSLSHALNIHAAARHAAEELNLHLTSTSFVVAHLGGGISIAPVRGGRIIDANDASSDGPFSPERTGGLPLQPLLDLCYSGQRSLREMQQMVMGKGGLVAYLGTNSAQEVESRIVAGDHRAGEVYAAMAYQIAKEIGAMATVLRGSLDATVLTGGLATSEMFVSSIRERIAFLGPVLVYPGEDEMRTLAHEALAVLRGTSQAKEY
jgi:butyrate kinase